MSRSARVMAGVAVGIVACGAGLPACSSRSTEAVHADSTPAAKKVDHSGAANKDRDTAIARLQSVGVLGEISCKGNAASVVVQPLFRESSAKDQSGFADLVYQQCFDGTDSSAKVALLDGDGRNVGQFEPVHGLFLTP